VHIHLDAIGGVAGDMFVAALCDALPQRRAGVVAAIKAVAPEIDCGFVVHHDASLAGSRFDVVAPQSLFGAKPGGHGHRSFTAVRALLDAAALDASVRARAIAIFGELADAEGRVHGVPADAVQFHEVGAWDSIADIVAAAYLIESLAPSTWSVGPLPLGGGQVQTAHGVLPVPAPATALLLHGFECADDGVGGERVTPTGAAILRQLGCNNTGALSAGRLSASGHGFGTRRLPGRANVLRVLLFDDAAYPAAADHVCEIRFEVDDQTSEDLAAGLDRLRAEPGVVEVWQFAASGKKNRLATSVLVLVRPEATRNAVEACFRETNTIGLRYTKVARTVLARRETAVSIDGTALTVKIANRPDGRRSAKADIDAVGDRPRAERERLRATAEARALGEDENFD
jgi:uncharacterized protein (TIGR00299 family) protein